MRKKNYSRPNRNYNRPNITIKNKETQRDQEHRSIQQPTIPIKKLVIEKKTDFKESRGVKRKIRTPEERQASLEELLGVKNPIRKAADHEVVLKKLVHGLTEKSTPVRELEKSPDPREQLNSLKTERKRIETLIKQLETDINNTNRQKNNTKSPDIKNPGNKTSEFKNDNEKSRRNSSTVGIGDSGSQQTSREKSEKMSEKISDKTVENLKDLKRTDFLTKEITCMCNILISECTKQRVGGSFYQHIKNAEKSRKISSEFRDYIYEFRNTLNKINSPEMSRAVIAGFDTTAGSVGTPGSDMKPIVGKNNPRHLVTYEIPKGEKGVFENGKRTIEVEEIWGSGQKSKLVYDKLTKKWIEDLSTIEMGKDRRTGKIRPLHTGEILESDTGSILPDPVISTQVKSHQGIKVIKGKKVPVWAPNPKIGVGRELAHISDRYPRALTRHFLKNSDVNRKESVLLFSFEDHRVLARDQKKVRQKAWELFIKEKNLTGKILDLDVCFHKARKDRKLAPRFNNDNTYPPMDYEENWINDMPDDEMPKFNGKPYGDKTFKEIHALRKQFGVRGATSGVKKYYAGNDPKIEMRFNEYLEDRLLKVEIRGEFKDLTFEQKYVLTKTREIAEYIYTYLYHPLIGRMSIDIDSQEKQVNKKDLEIKYGKHSKKFDEFINLLDDYGVPKKELILPVDKIGFDIEDRKNMLQEFADKNPYPVFDYQKIGKESQLIDSDIDIKYPKLSHISDTSKILRDVKDFSETAKNSADAFISSFFGHPSEILGVAVKGTLRHYNQNFKGINSFLGKNYYNIPPGTKYHTTAEIKREYDSFWTHIFSRNNSLREFDKKIQKLNNYHNQILQNKSTLELLNDKDYYNRISTSIKTQVGKLTPIQDQAYLNFKQIYDYSGDPNREVNRKRPAEIEFVWELFDKTNTNFHQIFNQKLKSNSNH